VMVPTWPLITGIITAAVAARAAVVVIVGLVAVVFLVFRHAILLAEVKLDCYCAI
jgi:hypothetical protein